MNTPNQAPSPAQPAPSPAQPARLLLKELHDQFAVFRECKPLAIGIDKQLVARIPEINRKLLRTALGIHTNSLRYLKAMERAKVRVDLDGNTADEVPETHRTHATKILRERAAKSAERREGQRKSEQAQRAAEEAEAAERQRAEKLNQLAAKFAKR